jgi:T4-like virus tail tube protein gp19
MAFNVNDFKTNGIIYGGARPSAFNIQIPAPPSNIGLSQSSIQKVQFLCSAASLPASTIGTVEIPYFGRKIKIAGDRTFADWTITVMNDEDFSLRSMFEMWSNALNQMVANLRPDDVDKDYKADILVNQYGKDGEVIRQYTLVGAFPTSVEAIPLNWNSTNQIEEFNVTLSYDYWIPTKEVSSKSQGLNNYSAQGASQSSTATNS